MTIKQSNQVGFTLIELIMVIVLLGVLSAFALPRFADLKTNAQVASLRGMKSALVSAAHLVHVQQVLENDMGAGGGININGTFVQTEFGYPSGNAGDFLATLEGDGAIKTAPFNDDCFEAKYCFNSRTASSGYPGLTTATADGRILIAYPEGYSRFDQCFTYYWYSGLETISPVIDVVSGGC